MHRAPPSALALSARTLRALAQLTAIAGALIFALFIAGIVARDPVFTALGVYPADLGGARIMGMRLIMVGGIAAAVIVWVVLHRLLAIVRTVQRGDPFVAENATRLREIAWGVLGLELLHIAIVALASWSSTPRTRIDIRWTLDVAQWLTVLLLFVLAHVFEQGARMRDDLDGTV